MIAFKEVLGKYFIKLKEGDPWKEISNKDYVDASTLSKGLMTVEQVNKLDKAYEGSIKEVTVDNNELTITNQSEEKIVDRLLLGTPYVPILRHSDMLLTEVEDIEVIEGKYKSNPPHYTSETARQYIIGNNIEGFTNATERLLDYNNNGYSQLESGSHGLYIMHKVRLANNKTFASDKRYYLRLKWRYNHATAYHGIYFKRGNDYIKMEDTTESPGRVREEYRLYDISGITGQDIVIFCHCSLWWSFVTEIKLFEEDPLQLIHRIGTYAQFSLIKDRLPETTQYFIKDINSSKGCLAIKVGDIWKDMLGNTIQDANHVVSV